MTPIKTLATGLTLAILPALPIDAAADGIDLAPGVQVVETKHGASLADADGMVLYIFDKDSDGETVCYDRCAQLWPPLLAPADAAPVGDFSLVTRTDGRHQWAYKGQPLYGWDKDEVSGDSTGHGFRDIWWIAKP